MNTRNDVPVRTRISEESMQPQMSHPQRRKPNPTVLRVLRLGMLASGALILVLTLALLILPAFKIQNIVVEGNSFYDDEYVIKKAGIALGDELFGWNMKKSCDAIIDAYDPYATDVYVSIIFPFTVKIEIVEPRKMMYAAHQNQYFSFDSTLRVLEILTDGEERFSPFLRVKLPAVAGVQKGAPIQFIESGEDLSHLLQLLDFLTERNLMERVTYVDSSNRFSLSFILSDSVRVEIGALRDMGIKLNLLQEELKKHPITETACAAIDVSNTAKPVWREIDRDTLFD